MSLTFKKIITFVVTVSFLMIVLFGVVTMAHNQNDSMPNDCPFSAFGVVPCIQNTIASAIHHISAYQALISFPIEFDIMTSIILILLFTCLVFISTHTGSPPKLFGRLTCLTEPDDLLFSVLGKKKVIRWLSLFENSPSFN